MTYAKSPVTSIPTLKPFVHPVLTKFALDEITYSHNYVPLKKWRKGCWSATYSAAKTEQQRRRRGERNSVSVALFFWTLTNFSCE